MSNYMVRSAVSCLIVGVLVAGTVSAQHDNERGDGHSWPSGLSMVEVHGTIMIDGTAPNHTYFLDEDGDLSPEYQLLLGPWWYEPDSGVARPVDGGMLTIMGTVQDHQSAPPRLMVFAVDGMRWRSAVEYGMHGWNGASFWVENGDTISSTGSVLIDTTYFYHHYYLDEDTDGVPEYQLGFGPHWYQPESITRPVDGQVVTVRGILDPRVGTDMLSVYELDGNTWRSFGDAAPWAGNWFGREHSDSLFTFCANDSVNWLRFPAGHMDGHRMGMGWPDSSFTQFWKIHPDSLPGPGDARYVMGFYIDTHDPLGTSMMGGQFGGHGGMMQFSGEYTMRLQYREEDLAFHNVSDGDLALRSWDAMASQWVPVTGALIDTQSNTVNVSGTTLSNFYSLLAAESATASDDRNETPSSYILFQNYPNPFNPVTTIRFSLPIAQTARLVLFDLVGRELLTLVDGFQPAGAQQVVLDAGALPSGTYIYRLDGPSGSVVRTLTLLR